jgi:DNA polymerase/3'-5' exonuclease PolX
MKTRTPRAQAMAVAQELLAELAPYTERIEVAGSLRRGCEEVGDIEIVAIAEFALDLFGEPFGESKVNQWLTGRGIKPTKDGDRYKQFEFGGYQVDLFIAGLHNWGLIYMLRTGGAEFSKRMVTPKAWGGMMPLGFQVREGQVWRSGEPLAVATEQELFDLWGIQFIQPSGR